jgi:hypothetical protein
VAATPDIHLLRGRETSTIVTTAQENTSLSLLQSTLLSSDGRLLPMGSLELCAAGACGNTVKLAAAAPHAVTIKVVPGFAEPGTYRGNVLLLASPKNDTSVAQFTVYSTTWEWRGAGAATILLGIAISLLATVVLRQRAARAAALLPAASLADALRELEPEMAEVTKQTRNELEGVRTRATELLRKLTVRFLDSKGYLPPRFGNPLVNAPDVSQAYQTHLATIGAHVAALRVIASKGLVPLTRGITPANEAASLAAIDSLDTAARTVETEAAALTLVKGALETVPNARQRRVDETVVTEMDVRVQLQNSGLAWWLLWGAITGVGGYAALIAQNPGFGGELDLLKCFFWGLGVQGAGQQLQQITPASVTNALKVATTR